MVKWKMKLGLYLITLILIPIASALPLCEDSPQISSDCTMVTPEISCGTYNYSIMNTSGHMQENGSLTRLHDSVYYFNFTMDAGEYIIRLCDGAVREVVVKEDDFTMLGVAITLSALGGLFIYLGYKALTKKGQENDEY